MNPDHLNFFKFIGRVIGKAVFDDLLLECYFSKPLYKMMVGEQLQFEDLTDLDYDYHRNCKWSLENDINDLEMRFSVNQDYFGRYEEKELVPGGRNIPVNNENKLEYFSKLAEFKIYT